MQFRQWIKNEINLDLSQPNVKNVSNSPATQKASSNTAKDAFSQFGPQIVQKMGDAPTSKSGAKVAMAFAQKVSKGPTSDNKQANPNTVGADIFKLTTGKDLKI